MKSLPMAASLCLLCACATVTPDHYYVLNSLPQGALEARADTATQIVLRVSLPALVDRSEMVLNTSADAVTVLEHERWAAPLAELVAQTLAQDFERRRADLLVTGQGLIQPAGAAIKVTIDLVRVTMRTGKQASVDAHWRILDTRTGTASLGRGLQRPSRRGRLRSRRARIERLSGSARGPFGGAVAGGGKTLASRGTPRFREAYRV
jgi:uncharacterized protein